MYQFIVPLVLLLSGSFFFRASDPVDALAFSLKEIAESPASAGEKKEEELKKIEKEKSDEIQKAKTNLKGKKAVTIYSDFIKQKTTKFEEDLAYVNLSSTDGQVQFGEKGSLLTEFVNKWKDKKTPTGEAFITDVLAESLQGKFKNSKTSQGWRDLGGIVSKAKTEKKAEKKEEKKEEKPITPAPVRQLGEDVKTYFKRLQKWFTDEIYTQKIKQNAEVTGVDANNIKNLSTQLFNLVVDQGNTDLAWFINYSLVEAKDGKEGKKNNALNDLFKALDNALKNAKNDKNELAKLTKNGFILSAFKLIARIVPPLVARLVPECVVWGLTEAEKEELVLETFEYTVVRVETNCDYRTWGSGECGDLKVARDLHRALSAMMSTEGDSEFAKKFAQLRERLKNAVKNNAAKINQCSKTNGLTKEIVLMELEFDENRVWCMSGKKVERTEDGKYYRKYYDYLYPKTTLSKYNDNCDTDLKTLIPNGIPYRIEANCEWKKVKDAIEKDNVALVETTLNILLGYTLDQTDLVCPLCFDIDENGVKLAQEYLEKKSPTPGIKHALKGLAILNKLNAASDLDMNSSDKVTFKFTDNRPLETYPKKGIDFKPEDKLDKGKARKDRDFSKEDTGIAINGLFWARHTWPEVDEWWRS